MELSDKELRLVEKCGSLGMTPEEVADFFSEYGSGEMLNEIKDEASILRKHYNIGTEIFLSDPNKMQRLFALQGKIFEMQAVSEYINSVNIKKIKKELFNL